MSSSSSESSQFHLSMRSMKINVIFQEIRLDSIVDYQREKISDLLSFQIILMLVSLVNLCRLYLKI